MPRIYRAMAAAGTTTILAYGAIWADSLDAAFRAAEAHGIRATLGAVMMDRLSYDDETPAVASGWTGACASPPSCASAGMARPTGVWATRSRPGSRSAAAPSMLRESAALAARYGAIWQTHLSEDAREIETVRGAVPGRRRLPRRLRPGRRPGPPERARPCHPPLGQRARPTGGRAAPASPTAPVSNLFISQRRDAPREVPRGRAPIVGLGSDVAGSPELSILTQMRTGFYAQNAHRVATGDPRPIVDPLGLLRLGTLEGARALGLDARDRVPGGRQGGRPHRDRPPADAAARRRGQRRPRTRS